MYQLFTYHMNHYWESIRYVNKQLMQKRKSSGAPEWPVPKIVYTINTTHFGRDKPRLNTHSVQCCRQKLRTLNLEFFMRVWLSIQIDFFNKTLKVLTNPDCLASRCQRSEFSKQILQENCTARGCKISCCQILKCYHYLGYSQRYTTAFKGQSNTWQCTLRC